MFGERSIKLFSVFGIRIGANPSWFIFLFLMIYWLSGYFSDILIGSSNTLSFGIAIAATLLSVVAFYHCLDAVQAVVINVLRGYKRALVPMFCNAFALWGVGLGGGYMLALDPEHLQWLGLSTPMGAQGFWIGAVGALVLANTLVLLYFLYVSREAPDAGHATV